MHVFCAVVDDDDTDKVTVGSLVTLCVTLHRSSLLEAGLMQLSDSTTLESTPEGDEVRNLKWLELVMGLYMPLLSGYDNFMDTCF